ncbi:hypothetical protein [Parapedobacter soli]|uniref:hypothetical protein n=1 Tax=Parapedobacter soli TaxID=416955 RepID=UPI0021C67A2F|nr:hypothetical protein [Parapedobacter soli]
MKTLFFVFFSISIAVAQSPDSTDRNIPKGYRIFYVNDSVDYLVIGKKGNQLFGAPRNDGSAEAMSANESFLRNNAKELIWMLDRSISYERAVELCEKNPKGELGVLLFFTPEPRLKEVYFNFRGFGGQVPLTFDEVNLLSIFIGNNIGAWYKEPDRLFERRLQLQYYIEWPWEIRTIRLVNYKKGEFRI